MLDRLSADVASALRSLAAAPALPVAAILTTALAVAMNLAMLGLIDRALFGVSSADPLVIGLAGAVVIVVAILATWVPAVAASRADPNMLLRAE